MRSLENALMSLAETAGAMFRFGPVMVQRIKFGNYGKMVRSRMPNRMDALMSLVAMAMVTSVYTIAFHKRINCGTNLQLLKMVSLTHL